MSTKIFTGFRLTLTNWNRIHDEIVKLQAETKPLVDRMAAKFLAERTVRLLDEAALSGKPVEQNPLSAAHHEFMERQKKIRATGLRDPEVDFEFTLVLVPQRKLGPVGMYFTEQKELADLWLSRPFVHDYAYWNNVDPDEDVRPSQWRRRMQTWNRVFDEAPTPALAGFTATIVEDRLYSFIPTEDVLRQLPHLEKRLRYAASDRVCAERLKETSKDKDPNDWSPVMEAIRWSAQTDEGRAAVAAEIEKIRPLLAETVTADILTGKEAM